MKVSYAIANRRAAHLHELRAATVNSPFPQKRDGNAQHLSGGFLTHRKGSGDAHALL